MSHESMTYTSLVQDLQDYTERTDDPFLNQVPRFIMMAENRIASEVRGLGYIKYVTADMAQSQPIIAKPSRWRETISINYGSGTGNRTRNFLLERTYEFCRAYNADPTVEGAPLYYGNYDYEHFIVSPTPDAAYPFEIAYHEKPLPLSDDNQTNWTTEYAPQLLLYACLVEAETFLKNADKVQQWQALYDRAARGLQQEDARRVSDRSTSLK